ncbi:M20 family metallopeptidase [Paenibacillus sp. PK4536]|uniref:M20 metallopeptidase family protein n=1 Tax=Paenibacillus sp. PK4536 TaxID=3024576 RepID=UPI00235932C5|nr:M20 family metallopeptidase [Paenibacillus sp. PK4536]WIM38950.1 M20 family metallopeptidase [Paenibacillus sp. PK4536]
MGNYNWEALFPDMVEWRRHLHRNPELSYQEHNTMKFIADQLIAFGIDTQSGVGDTGVIGTIKGSLPGKTVALRADIDALPIQDEKECEYASQVEGVMHACGHDGHTAGLLAVARYFSENRDTLKGEIRLIFQPGEEVCPGGALKMIAAGALEGVDVIYGVHLWSPLPVHTLASAAGPIMASVDDFVIDITGKGGHGGIPHVTVDSVLTGAQLVVQLQSIVSRNVNPLQPAVLTIGTINSGTAKNIIAETCRITGTVRTFDEETRAVIRKRFEEVTQHTCAMNGATVEIDYMMGYPPLVNHAGETERFFQVAKAVFGEEQVQVTPPMMPAEDFSYYVQQVPGCFIFVGAGNEYKGITYPHHHPRFDIDEAAILNAAKILVSMAENYLEQQDEIPFLEKHF